MVGRATSEMRRTEFATSGPHTHAATYINSTTKIIKEDSMERIMWIIKNIIIKTSQANWFKGCL